MKRLRGGTASFTLPVMAKHRSPATTRPVSSASGRVRPLLLAVAVAVLVISAVSGYQAMHAGEARARSACARLDAVLDWGDAQVTVDAARKIVQADSTLEADMSPHCGNSLNKLGALPAKLRRMAKGPAVTVSDHDGLTGQEPAANEVGVLPYLARRGVTRMDVVLLGHIADRTGYGLGPGTTLTFQQAQDLAIMMVDNCERVRQGKRTWHDLVAEDVSVGATSSDAVDMYNYVSSQFCTARM